MAERPHWSRVLKRLLSPDQWRFCLIPEQPHNYSEFLAKESKLNNSSTTCDLSDNGEDDDEASGRGFNLPENQWLMESPTRPPPSPPGKSRRRKHVRSKTSVSALSPRSNRPRLGSSSSWSVKTTGSPVVRRGDNNSPRRTDTSPPGRDSAASISSVDSLHRRSSAASLPTLNEIWKREKPKAAALPVPLVHVRPSGVHTRATSVGTNVSAITLEDEDEDDEVLFDISVSGKEKDDDSVKGEDKSSGDVKKTAVIKSFKRNLSYSSSTSGGDFSATCGIQQTDLEATSSSEKESAIKAHKRNLSYSSSASGGDPSPTYGIQQTGLEAIPSSEKETAIKAHKRNLSYCSSTSGGDSSPTCGIQRTDQEAIPGSEKESAMKAHKRNLSYCSSTSGGDSSPTCVLQQTDQEANTIDGIPYVPDIDMSPATRESKKQVAPESSPDTPTTVKQQNTTGSSESNDQSVLEKSHPEHAVKGRQHAPTTNSSSPFEYLPLHPIPRAARASAAVSVFAVGWAAVFWESPIHKVTRYSSIEVPTVGPENLYYIHLLTGGILQLTTSSGEIALVTPKNRWKVQLVSRRAGHCLVVGAAASTTKARKVYILPVHLPSSPDTPTTTTTSSEDICFAPFGNETSAKQQPYAPNQQHDAVIHMRFALEAALRMDVALRSSATTRTAPRG